MKTVLVPTSPHELMGSVLATAHLMARRFDSYVEGFALRPALTEYIPFDMVGGLTWVRDDAADEEAVRRSRQMFETFMRDKGVPYAREEGGLSYGWLEKAQAGDEFVASYGRVFDLTVLGRPVTEQAYPSMATLEAVLFESGRPILIAPPTAPTSLGDTIVIAWNGSTETARTTADGMPFLHKAQRVVVLTVEGGNVPGPSGEELARCLRRNGIPAEARTVTPERRSVGETILDQAAALGCDLLIKGAYTQSRLRQMIFGGATSHILAEAQLPVLMSH
ncbi:MAG TPA: universal stress protein [Beijerinckiaceae bacterium]|nr:universal stress protein [Beijerinckiaceae bacterium]